MGRYNNKGGRFNKRNHRKRGPGGRDQGPNAKRVKPFQFSKTEGVLEEQVGITHFLYPHQPVFGILKQRYSDFLVYEVDSKGNIVHLNSFFGSKPRETTQPKTTSKEASDDTKPKCDDIDKLTDLEMEAGVQQLREQNLFPEDILEKLLIMMKATNSRKKKQEQAEQNNDTATEEGKTNTPPLKEIRTGTCDDKAKRSMIHQTVRSCIGKWIETGVYKTEDNEQGIYLFPKKKSQSRQRKAPWPTDLPDYLKFTLYKENLDTNVAITLLAQALKVPKSAIEFAGTKDKRGVTVQQMTVKRVKKETLEQAARTLHAHRDNLLIGDAEYVDHPIMMGGHSGNHFQLVLRNVSVNGVCPGGATAEERQAKEEVDGVLASWKSQGFVNYFGLQRFGSGSAPTHKVGKLLLRQDWAGAVDLLLGNIAKEILKDAAGDGFRTREQVLQVLPQLPRYFVSERALMEGLLKTEMDPRKALSRIPRNLNMMYVHAYQSYVWNTVASARLAASAEIAAGDLVMLEKCHAGFDSLREGKSSESGTLHALGPDKVALVVTQADVDSGLVTVRDVALPMVGVNSIFPQHPKASKEEFSRILKADGIDIDLMGSKVSDYHLKGSYRVILQVPKHASWSWHRYTTPEDSVVDTDADKVKAAVAAQQASASSVQVGKSAGEENRNIKEEDTPMETAEATDEIVEPGPKSGTSSQAAKDGSLGVAQATNAYAALVLNFTLATSTYATMCIREVLGASTNGRAQANANEYLPGQSKPTVVDVKKDTSVVDEKDSTTASEPTAQVDIKKDESVENENVSTEVSTEIATSAQ